MVERFLSVDPVTAYSNPIGAFNGYRYANNNPYRFTDPDGRWAEDLIIGIPSIALGLKSGYDNIRAGNYGMAAVDAVGVALDAAAIATPGVPGGAGLAIKAVRGADAVVGAARAVDAGEATTTLYRAVGPAELSDITSSGQLVNRGSAEGKYFTASSENASSYAKKAVAAFSDAPYTTIQVDVPTSALPSPVSVDGGIPAYVIPDANLPGLKPEVLNSMAIPERR